MNIGDIYAGKLDASDEIRERGYGEFEKNYIKPSGVSIDSLASVNYGTPFFIMGDKGTGKTALLHFLEKYVREIDAAACSSFISFEKNFSPPQKAEFNAISATITIDKSIASVGKNDECDYTYIWKWQLYQKIISDNEQFNNGLFIDDIYWKSFISEISKIDKTIHKNKLNIPASIEFSAETNPQLGTIIPAMKIEPVDLSQRSFNSSRSYNDFVKIIDKADDILKNLTRSDIPYYIFIDELEAYRGTGDTFYRDLRMIRDLLFVVKNLNDLFGTGTKLICSVRLEIINAINRFIEPKQLHKITQGYDERLVWEHTNTNSFKHPIIGILLRRIQCAVEEKTGHIPTQEELINQWFVQNVSGKHICSYILDNSWNKPRDIVRLILSAQEKNSKNFTQFNQAAFATFMPEYSRQCLLEIKEEMRALYTTEEIDCIINCLQGFRARFSYQDIDQRVNRLYPQSVFANNTLAVLNDLYRIGIIGNSNDENTSPQWSYKGRYTLMIDDPWKMVIHPALRIELSVNLRNDYRFNRTQKKKDEIVYNATITCIKYKYILVSFEKYGVTEEGYIAIHNLGIPEIQFGQIENYFSVNDIIHAIIQGYNKEYSNWYMRVVP